MNYVTLLKSKLHRAKVTDTNLDYEGSITIDKNLIEAANLLVFEKVQVLDLNNGERFETYVIEGERGSRQIIINGAAARLVHQGDRVIILAYVHLPESEARLWQPKIIILDDNNNPQ